eukprot:TRINITY_DN75235_c0_g1_i1.p1 TRINITY_DN75235_c0_g1~~TRINITY_DN75235_c0_g1_i1.p1  ORF type:complete len:517 (+),score=48.52 TRINITY_DN75235_c0_g1_i1:35-1585(+)
MSTEDKPLKFRWFEAAKNGDLAELQQLTQDGFDPTTHDSRSYPHGLPDDGTALLYAAANGHMEVVKWLLSDEGGCDLTERDRQEFTALLWAVHNGHLELSRWLIDEKGCCAETELSDDGSNALLMAAGQGRFEVVRYLVEEVGVPLDSRDNQKWNAALVGGQSDNLEMVKWLVDEKGCSVDDVDIDGQTALHIACWSDAPRVAKWLIEEKRQMDETTPHLFSAVVGGSATIAKYLVTKHNASLTERSTRFDDPTSLLHWAALCDTSNCIKYLLEEALVDTVGERMYISMFDLNAEEVGSPLHRACNGDNLQMVTYLLVQGWWVTLFPAWTLKLPHYCNAFESCEAPKEEEAPEIQALVKQAWQAGDSRSPIEILQHICSSTTPEDCWWELQEQQEDALMHLDDTTWAQLAAAGWVEGVEEETPCWSVKSHASWPVGFRLFCEVAMWCICMCKKGDRVPPEVVGGVFQFWGSDAFSPRLLWIHQQQLHAKHLLSAPCAGELFEGGEEKWALSRALRV